MAKREHQARGESVGAASVDPPEAEPHARLAFLPSRKHINSAGNVVHMDRKRDERLDQPDATDANQKSEAGPSPADRTRMTDQIGRQLRGMYDGLLSQPVPDRFLELVQRLESGDVKGKTEK